MNPSATKQSARPLDRIRVLVTNDDGIGAPGLAVLERIAGNLSQDVWTVAPAGEQSGSGHSLTLSRPLRITHLAERRYSVDGTPTDCVLLARQEILGDAPPDLVLSGVNLGGNIADQITYSGTIAAAMEATLLGMKAIALSLAVPWGEVPVWDAALERAASVLRQLWEAGWPDEVFINVNIPNCPPADIIGAVVAHAGKRIETISTNELRDPRGRRYYWLGGPGERYGDPEPGSDVMALQARKIAITPLHLHLTHDPSLRALAAKFEE